MVYAWKLLPRATILKVGASFLDDKLNLYLGKHDETRKPTNSLEV